MPPFAHVHCKCREHPLLACLYGDTRDAADSSMINREEGYGLWVAAVSVPGPVRYLSRVGPMTDEDARG